jgi:hypothetical protein
MSFRDQGWSSRFTKMGDEAEAAFETWAGRNAMTVERLGWDRPQMGVAKMSPQLRHLPDFYASDGHLYEVVGMGRDGVLKGIKVDKWESLKFWNSVQAVRVFVWNSALKTMVLLPWPTLVQVVAKARRDGIQSFENDGNQYYPIKWAWLEPYSVGEVNE